MESSVTVGNSRFCNLTQTSRDLLEEKPLAMTSGVVTYDAPQGGKVRANLDRVCLALYCVRNKISKLLLFFKAVSLPDGEAKGNRR